MGLFINISRTFRISILRTFAILLHSIVTLVSRVVLEFFLIPLLP